MRDPERIDIVLAALRQGWLLNTDSRLGQLVSNAAFSGGWEGGNDVFHCEDDVTLKGLENMIGVYGCD